jgi:serine/threonine protein phosphatase 1
MKNTSLTVRFTTRHVILTGAMSDLHSRYDRYCKMLEKINFSDADTLYVLGDCLDSRNEEADCEIIKFLQDMINRKNVINLQGNHEFWALPLLKPLTKINFADYGILAYKDYDFGKTHCDFRSWLSFGGLFTLEQFVSIPQNELASCSNTSNHGAFTKT